MFEALATAIDELEISVDERELLAALALRDRLSARVTWPWASSIGLRSSSAPASREWGQMAHARRRSPVDNGAMASKRAAARLEAAEMVDIAARLAPFFPPPVVDLVDRNDDRAKQNVS